MIEMNNGESSTNGIIELFKDDKLRSRIEDSAYLIHKDAPLKSKHIIYE